MLPLQRDQFDVGRDNSDYLSKGSLWLPLPHHRMMTPGRIAAAVTSSVLVKLPPIAS